LWIGIAAPAANADVIYDYTGTPFTRCGSSPDCPADYTSDYIIASITLAAPLAPNLPLTDELSSLIAWTISDSLGNFSFSSTDPDAAAEVSGSINGCADMSFSTNSGGKIVDWCVGAGNVEFLGLTINPTFIGGSGLPIADTFLINPGMGDQENVTTSTPGQWTETPEPSTLILLGGAILIIAMKRKHRTRPATQTTL
jgi:PEP-CTERM motif